MKLTYDIHEKPKFGQNLVFALQQLLAIIAATLLVPTLVNGGNGGAYGSGGGGATHIGNFNNTLAATPSGSFANPNNKCSLSTLL